MVPGDGIQALVPGRHQQLRVRTGLEAEAVLRPRVGLVLEAGALQGQGDLADGPAVLAVVAHGLAVQEIEDLQPDGVRIALLIMKGKVRDGAVFHGNQAVFQKFLAVAVEAQHGVGVTFCGAQTGGDVLPGGQGLRPAQKYAPDAFRQRLVLRPLQQDAGFLLGAEDLIPSFDGGGALQRVQARRQPLQRQLQHVTGQDGAVVHGLRVRGAQEAIGERKRHGAAYRIARRQLQDQFVLIHHVIDGPLIPVQGAVRFLLRREGSVGRILQVDAHLDFRTHIDAGFEALRLAGTVRHDGLDFVAPLLGGEGGVEGVIGLNIKRLLLEDVAVTAHLDGDARPRQRMPGVGDQAAAHRDFISGEVELFIRVERHREVGQDEFVHAEVIACQQVLPFIDLQREIAVPEAFGQGEFSGNGAERIGGEFLGADHIFFRVRQFHLNSLALEHFHAPHGVSGVQDGLETEGVAGVVGTAVLVDVAAEFVAVFTVGIGVERHRLGAAVAAFGAERIVGLAVQEFLEVLG